MASLKQLARIKKIYELRAQNAERRAAERAAFREGLEGVRDATNLRLREEVESCDSLVRAPFDYAARYYRATLKTIALQEDNIQIARDDEAEARSDLRQRYIEKKEFEIYYNRKYNMYKEEIRIRKDSEAREHSPKPEGDDGASVAMDWRSNDGRD